MWLSNWTKCLLEIGTFERYLAPKILKSRVRALLLLLQPLRPPMCALQHTYVCAAAATLAFIHGCAH